jgi:hypothetical protein
VNRAHKGPYPIEGGHRVVVEKTIRSLAVFLESSSTSSAHGARLDIATFKGIRANQLMGYDRGAH